jgi:hypothetical protein
MLNAKTQIQRIKTGPGIETRKLGKKMINNKWNK